jgi:outer membrane protein insertion porin family
VGLTFAVKEGPKVKVGKITFEGNKAIKSRELQTAMKNLKPIGIPILFSWRACSPRPTTRQAERRCRARPLLLQTKGYFKALVADPKTKIRDTPPPWYWPFTKTQGKGGGHHHAGGRGRALSPEGNHVRRQQGSGRYPLHLLGSKIKDGDVLTLRRSARDSRTCESLCRAGLHQLLAGAHTDPDDENKTIALKIGDLDEGNSFRAPHRVQGNTTTRDKVIRRELALEEGNVFNGNLWS